MVNIVLSIHAQWLKDNGYEYKQCLKEAHTLKQQTDKRQTEGFSTRRRYEVQSRRRHQLASKI